MTTTTKKRDYLWMLDILPALALGQFCSKWLLTVFHGTPEASGWVAAISLAIGGGVGFVLSSYLRAQVTNIIQNRRTAFIVSFSVSLGLALAIVTATVLIEKSASQSQNSTAQPSLDLTEFAGKLPQLDLTQFADKLPQLDLIQFAQPAPPSTTFQQTKALAEQGNHIAQINLGVKYKFGLGVTQDYQEALKWFHLSAAQGNTSAPGYLGDMYAKGQGVPRDYAQSMMWYLIAKAYESTSVRDLILEQNLQILESNSTPAQIAEAQRMARNWWAARHSAN